MDDLQQHRPRLFALAYRMLGSTSDADDILQDAWLRYAQQKRVDRAGAWLTTCVTRLCIDRLRSAQRRREVYVGPWLPEPLFESDPLDTQSVSLAFLHLLERLSPKERAVYLLREVFDYTHTEIADAIGMSGDACRQALIKARARIGEGPRFAPTQEAHASILLGFAAAVQSGDLAGLEQLLAEDVQAITDAGGQTRAALRVVSSRDRVARFFLGLKRKQASADTTIQPVVANGWPALMVSIDGVRQVLALETDGSKVFTVFVLMNPDKLTRLVP